MNQPKVLDASKLKEVKFQLIQADIPTANNNIYPSATMERAVNKYNQLIAQDQNLGEFWDGANQTSSTLVDLRKVSHRIKSLAFDKKTGITTGTLHVLKSTNEGKKLADYLKEGNARPVMFGFGSPEVNGDSNVVLDFEFISINFCPIV